MFRPIVELIEEAGRQACPDERWLLLAQAHAQLDGEIRRLSRTLGGPRPAPLEEHAHGA